MTEEEYKPLKPSRLREEEDKLLKPSRLREEEDKPLKPQKISLAQKILLGIAALGIAGTVAYNLIDNYRNRAEVLVSKDSSQLEVTFNKYTSGDLEKRIFTQYRKCTEVVQLEQSKYFKPKYLVDINGDSLNSRSRVGNSLDIRNRKHSEKFVSYYDFDCDGKVDLLYSNHLSSLINKYEGKPELFKKVNEELAQFKKDIQKHMDLEKETKEWLGEK